MDIERETRVELMALLGNCFLCHQEVLLNVRGQNARCDILARPRIDSIGNTCLLSK
jgi:hypothetical protein